MKKTAATMFITLLLVGFGGAMAQSSQSHQVQVALPNVLMIRLTMGDATAAITSPSAVIFDLSGLSAAAFDPEGTYPPTNVATSNWDDVQVLANAGGTWTVSMATNNGLFDWSKITVTPVVGGLVTAAFDLPSNGSEELHDGTGSTNGWSSLGFGPDNFRLALDGSETAGGYSTTVTYSIATP
jgi:hypothetical protein